MATCFDRARTLRFVLALIVAIPAFSAVRAQTCDPLPRGPLAWLTGDNTPNDLTPNANHGILINGATFGPGVNGAAFSLDGINDRVDVSDAPSLRPTLFTVAAWINLDTASQISCIICKQVGSGDSDSYSLWLNGGILRGGMFTYAEATGTAQLPINQWIHVAVTYDGSIIRLYQDGKILATAPGPVSPVPYDTNQVLIGAEDNGVAAYSYFFKGKIDEALIYGRALTACEIRALAATRLRPSCKTDQDGDSFLDFVDNCPGVSNVSQVDLDADGTGDACDCAPANPAVYAVPGDRNILGFVSHDNLDWCLDPSFTGTATVYDVQRGDVHMLPVTMGTSECRSHCGVIPSGLVGWWPGDASTTDLVAANNGTLENGATYGAGWVRGAFSFDGSNDRVRTAGNLTLGNTFTVAAWVNSDPVNQTGYRRIVETNYTTGFFLGVDGTGAGYKFIVKNGVLPYGAANGGKISPGDWQFVAGTYDGTTGTLYVDGVAVASDTFSPPGTISLPVNIGAYVLGGFTWKGRIDEVQVFNRVLTSAELRTLYEKGSAGLCKQGFGGVDAEWTAPFGADLAIPNPGQGFWYLYRGRNSCGTGSYGFATSGTERIGAICF